MALSGMAFASGLGSGLFNLAQLGYGIYQDQRDFKYTQEQADLARKREDSAIQRRVKDAVKAGINPYDAIGSGAGAGAGPSASFSSRALPNGPNFGSTLDYLLEAEKIKQERDNTETNRILQTDAKYRAKMSYLNYLDANEAFAYEHGYYPHIDFYSGRMGVDDIDRKKGFPMSEGVGGNYNYNNLTPFERRMNASLDNYLNNADMLRKQNMWYNTNQLLDAINSGTGSVGNIMGAFGKAGSGYRDFGFGYKLRNNEPIIKPRIGFYE